MIFIICAILIWRHHIQWIHPDPTLHRLKMQVAACAVASIAHIPNNLPCRYRLTCGDGSLHHMGIACGQARAVIQQNLIAVAVVPAADQHRTAVGGEDRRTLRCGNVRAAMAGVAVSSQGYTASMSPPTRVCIAARVCSMTRSSGYFPG